MNDKLKDALLFRQMVETKGVNNARNRFVSWLLENMNRDYVVIGTMRDMSERSNISVNTVVQTMAALQQGEHPILEKVSAGAYQVTKEFRPQEEEN